MNVERIFADAYNVARQFFRNPLEDAGLPSRGFKNNAGRAAELLPGQTIELISVDGTPNRGQQMVITLGPDTSALEVEVAQANVPTQPAVCDAIIEWGQDGSWHRVVVDYRLGTNIAVYGATARVRVRNLSATLLAKIAASIAYGTTRNDNTVTIPFEAAETPVPIRIPSMARRVHFVTTTPGPIFFRETSGGPNLVRANGNLAWQSSSIPNNARFMVADEDTIFVFDLAL